jgi:hypothetical protein
MMRARVCSAAVALVIGAVVAATTATVATAEPRPVATGAGASPPAAEASAAAAAEMPSAAAAETPSAVRPAAPSAGRVVAVGTVVPLGTGGHLHGPARALEVDVGAFIDRFKGEWQGSGIVIGDAGDPPRRVSCTAIGSTGPISLDITGDCRALAIFRRAIGATLVHDGGRFTGTYVGSRIGDARLVGDVENDTLVMTMEWPEEVNGDTTAEMRLTNPGDGTLSLEVVDEINGVDGSETFLATELVFEKVEAAQ